MNLSDFWQKPWSVVNTVGNREQLEERTAASWRPEWAWAVCKGAGSKCMHGTGKSHTGMLVSPSSLPARGTPTARDYG